MDYCSLLTTMGCTEPVAKDGLCDYHNRILTDPSPRTLDGRPNGAYRDRMMAK